MTEGDLTGVHQSPQFRQSVISDPLDFTTVKVNGNRINDAFVQLAELVVVGTIVHPKFHQQT